MPDFFILVLGKVEAAEVPNSWPRCVHSQEESGKCALLSPFISPCPQPRIPAREECHPHWGGSSDLCWGNQENPHSIGMPRVILDSLQLKISIKHLILISIQWRILPMGNSTTKKKIKSSLLDARELVCLASQWTLPAQPSPSLLYPTKLIAL